MDDAGSTAILSIGKKKKKMNLNINLTSFTKINSDQTTDLHVKHATLKLLENSIQENLQDSGLGKDFPDYYPKHRL